MEVLIVTAIISIVIGLTLAAVQRVRESAAQTECADNLRQLAVACHSFNDWHGRMPPAFGFMPKGNIYHGAALGPLFFHLLPDLDQQNLFKQSRYRPPSTPQQDFYFYTANGVHQTPVAAFNCPSDPTNLRQVNPKVNYAVSSYAGNYLVFGIVDKNYKHRKAQGRPTLTSTFRDGASNTESADGMTIWQYLA